MIHLKLVQGRKFISFLVPIDLPRLHSLYVCMYVCFFFSRFFDMIGMYACKKIFLVTIYLWIMLVFFPFSLLFFCTLSVFLTR
jgi:hypothetical protein